MFVGSCMGTEEVMLPLCLTQQNAIEMHVGAEARQQLFLTSLLYKGE